MDTLDTMRVFVQVSDMGSFIKAAHVLDMPRTTVSLAVQQLEQRFGVRLLQRTTRQVSLTSDGRRLLLHCRRVLAEMDTIDSVLLPSDSGLTGHITVDVPSRIAHGVLIPALPDFFRRYPNIALTVGARDRVIDLVQEGVDCALRVGALESSSLVARPLGQFRQINCASPAYLAVHGMPDTLESLAQHGMVGYASPVSGRVLPWSYRLHDEDGIANLPCKVVVNNVESYISGALAGLGMIQVPAFDVRTLLQEGRLVEVLPMLPVPSLPVALMYPHRQIPARVRAFSAWLEGVVAEHLSY